MIQRRLMMATVTLAFGLLVTGCASTGGGKPGAEPYGPLTFNKPGADFYFSQGGQFTPAQLGKDGVIVIHLKNAPFQLGHAGRQLNLALAQTPISEISTDPKGFKASRLSGPMAGGREPDSDVLLVYGGKEWTDGNTGFSDDTSRRTNPLPGFRYAYQVNQIAFLADERWTLANFKGVLHGYIVVYKQHERHNRDIMPIRLVFSGPGAAH
jgi:hypothetical protein